VHTDRFITKSLIEIYFLVSELLYMVRQKDEMCEKQIFSQSRSSEA
jgi:hypothetical protein